MRPAGPVAALAASALALGAVTPDRLAEVHIALVAVSAQPAPKTGGVPQVVRRDRRTRWRVSYNVTGKTNRPLASYARITLQHGATRWRFRSARVTQTRRHDLGVPGRRPALVSRRARDADRRGAPDRPRPGRGAGVAALRHQRPRVASDRSSQRTMRAGIGGGLAKVAQTALIGRDAELERVEEFLAAIGSGPIALLLEGEIGIGKTALWNQGGSPSSPSRESRLAIPYAACMISVSAADSPIGVLTLARGPRGLLRLALAGETPQSVADDLRERLGVRVAEDDSALADVRDQLDRYFAGELQEFDVELDWTLVHGFRRACCEAMLRIPYGTTVTYGELAADAGNLRAVRAAGQACATNPIAIIGPCHRVLAADGLGGYGGGLDQKCALLALEGALLVA